MSDEAEAATKHCKNCKRDIAESNYVIHEVHCQRNIVLCEHCHEPVPRVDLETHVKDVHAPVNCELCGSAVERDNVEWHKSDECSRRPCVCEYCELVFTAENHAEHVEYCGSRTEPCPLCGQFIKLRDRRLHEESNCTLPPAAAPPARSNADFDCDGMEAYHLSQLDHLLCHDVAGNTLWMPHQQVQFGRNSHTMPVGRMYQARGFMKRNRPSQLPDRREVIAASGAKNNDFIYRRPKVMNGPPRASSTSVPSADDAECNLLPCEFCSNTFPPDILLQHQVFCGHQDLPDDDDDRREYGVNLLRESEDRTSSEPTDSQCTNGSLSPPWIVDHTSGDSEDVVLPCEFCEELLPSTQLAFHQSNCEMARLFGATTPQIPLPAGPVARRMKPVGTRRLPLWNDDQSSAASRSSRHQGPPPHHRHNPTAAAGDHGRPPRDLEDIPPHDGGRQRRNVGSRPALHTRPRVTMATATGPSEQSSPSDTKQSEESHQLRSGPHGSADVMAPRHVSNLQPRRLPSHFTNRLPATNNPSSRTSHGSQTSDRTPAQGVSEAAASLADETHHSVRPQPTASTHHSMRSQPAGGTRRNNTGYRPDNRPPRMMMSRYSAPENQPTINQHQRPSEPTTSRPLPNGVRPRRPAKIHNNHDDEKTPRYRRGNSRPADEDQ